MADDQAPDQVQPRGAEHGPEGQQETESVKVRFVGEAVVPPSVAEALVKLGHERDTSIKLSQYVMLSGWSYHVEAEGRWLHDSEDRQKETKP